MVATEPRTHHAFSPSRLEQYRLCPGSYHMQKGIPDIPSPAAEEGTLLHKAVATGDFTGLTEEQVELVKDCIEFRNKLMRENNMVHFGSEVALTVFKGNTLLTEGWADDVLVRYAGDGITIEACIVIDYKFGWSLVTEAIKNIQTGTYCAGAILKFGCKSAEAYIYQPRLHRSSSYVFSVDTLPIVIDNIERIIEDAKAEDFVLHPCEIACRFCRARLACPAFRMKFQNLAASRNTYDLSDPKTLESLFDASKDVKNFMREIEDAVRKMIEDTGRCGKYGFKITEGRREVKAIHAMYQRVSDYISREDFLSLCTITLGKLESYVADKLILDATARGEKLTKAEAKRRFFDATKDLIDRGNPTKTITVIGE